MGGVDVKYTLLIVQHFSCLVALVNMNRIVQGDMVILVYALVL